MAGFVTCDFDFITPLWGHARADHLLSNMVAALGAVFLASRSKDRNLIMRAGQKYSRVLQKSTAALCNVEIAKSDEMLATVWLLALYEVCKKP